MYDGVKVRLAARTAAESAADETVRTMRYRFGLPALLVDRLDMEVVPRDGLDECIERGVDGGGAAPICFVALLPTLARQ